MTSVGEDAVAVPTAVQANSLKRLSSARKEKTDAKGFLVFELSKINMSLSLMVYLNTTS